MKIHGVKLNKSCIETIVLLRKPENVILTAGAVLNYDEFYKLCPPPIAPPIMLPGGVKSVDVDDPNYKKQTHAWAEKKTAYMILTSLNHTEGLEWETVNLKKPNTWANYQTELRDSGCSDSEITRIIEAVITACGLNEEKIEEATKLFLATQEAKLKG